MKLFNFIQKDGNRSKKGRKKYVRVVPVRSYTPEDKLKILQEYEVAEGTIERTKLGTHPILFWQRKIG